jgi:filamentous hemagglutinin
MAAKKAAGGLEVEAVVGAKEAGSTGLSNAEMGPFVPQLSRYEDRIKLTPINGGSWAGVRGESNFVFDNPEFKKILPDGIAYRNGYPDFSPVTLHEVRLPGLISTNRDANFRAANQMLANKLGLKESDVARFMREEKFTWHEVEDMRRMQLVPSFIHTGKVNSMDFGVKYGHLGGVAEKALLEAVKK